VARGSRGHRRTRDASDIARPPLRSPKLKALVQSLERSARENDAYLDKLRKSITDIEDRRRFDFEKHKARASIRSAARLEVDNRREFDRRRIAADRKYNQRWNVGPFHIKLFDQAPAVPEGVKFHRPYQVAICVRRHIRREVMHALQLTNRRRGRGGGRKQFRRAKWNEFSLIRC